MKPATLIHLLAAAALAPVLAPALAQDATPLPGPGPAITAPPAIVASAPAVPLAVPLPPAPAKPAPKPLAGPTLAPAKAAVPVPTPTPAERRARAARIDALEAAVLRRLASPEAERIFRRYNATHGRQIQHHLADIYGKEPAFIADAGGAGRPLGDSIVGPVTLKWLGRFCGDYGIVASDPRFEEEVVASLEQVAAIARAHPDWQKVLFSAEFEAWINEQPSPQRIRNLKIRRSGAAAQVNALIEQYLQSVRPRTARMTIRHAPLEVTYSYDPKRPAGTGNLAAIAERLKPIAGREPTDEHWFVDDVREALAGMELSEETLNLIKRHSQVDVYMVRPEMLVKLRKEGMPEPVVTNLNEQMGGIEFGTVQEFVDALALVAQASSDPAAIEGKQRRLVREARFARYRVPATLAADLMADAPLEPPLADLFAGIAGVVYPTKELFDKALEFQVRRALGMCPQPEAARGRPLDASQFDALALLLPSYGEMFGRIRALRADGIACSPEQLVEADALAYQAYTVTSPSLDRKMVLETSNVVVAEPPRTSSWAPPDCRCGKPATEGVVYGFYPVWTQAGERQIDFGALSRIGLYGLTVDARGTLQAPRGMAADTVPGRLAGLLREAHRYRVGVDWVVARHDWSAWTQARPAQKREFFERLTASLVDKLNRPLPDGGQALTRLASLGVDRGPTSGDGVVLYFRDYPAADATLFNEFVTTLTARLRDMRPARTVSLMVDYSEMGTPGPFALRNLSGLVARANPIDADMSFADSKLVRLNDMPILVLLPEPTQDTKKNLRGAIQDALRGTESLRLMQAIVPVVEFDGASSEQLAADIVYISQIYWGIGFWPLPFASSADDIGNSAATTTSVNRLLALYYQASGDPPSRWDHYIGYLCPHRLWLRWLAWVLLLVATVVGVLYFRCRGCNERLDNSLLYFSLMAGLMALPLVALFVLVLSDPVLEPYAPALLVLYGTGGIALAALVARYYFNKSRRKVP